MALPTRTNVQTLDYSGAGQPAAYLEAKALSPSSATLDYTLNAQPVFALAPGTGPVTLFPSLFTNTNTFYSATITPGAVALQPTLLVNTNVFYSATVSSTVTLAPALYTNTNVFYSPMVGSLRQGNMFSMFFP